MAPTITSIHEQQGLRYLQYTVLIACTEALPPLVFQAKSVDHRGSNLEIVIKAFGKENYDIMRKGLRARCFLFDHLVYEEVYLGCYDLSATEESFFDIWSLGPAYNSIGVRGIAKKVKEAND